MCEQSNYINAISKICERLDSAEKLGKKKLQKLMYLIERKGVALNLNYGIHFYGPYSSKLDNIIHVLQSKDVITIDTSKTTHEINIKNQVDYNYESDGDEDKLINMVLEQFIHKTPLELEAITTIDYVYNNLSPAKEKDIVLAEVKKIKGNKFNDSILSDSFELLKAQNYIA